MDDVFNNMVSPIDDTDLRKFEKDRLENAKRKLFPAELVLSSPSKFTNDISSMDIQFDDGTLIYGNSCTIQDSEKDTKYQHVEITETKRTVALTNDLTQKNSNNDAAVKKITRKRSRNPENWKMNIRKKKRETGQEYTDIKGKIHPERSIKFACKNETCKFKCASNITFEEHTGYWKLSDSKKGHFYSKYVIRTPKARSRGSTNRKSFSFQYFFEVNEKSFRVCKNFFLGTLDISAQRIYYHYTNINNKNTGLPRSPLKGKNTKKVLPEVKKDEIRDHIRSFPIVESHYCRVSSNKSYLESNLNLTKMYRLYCLKVKEPLKFHVYSKIFNFEFNLSFHNPKKDICDKCVEFRLKSNPTEGEVMAYENHIANKERGKQERDLDRQNTNKDTAIVTFDLENVFSLPKSNVSSHFYKQKLNCYNLTAHCNLNKTIYCSIWNEGMTGRGGIELSNALIKILSQILQDIKGITKIILWSDSCVPQNKNSIMSFALQNFLNTENNLKTIEQKFSEPGHSTLQEIDSAHSVIEKHIRFLDIHSPLSLVRALLKIPDGKLKYRILQMNSANYRNYTPKLAKLRYNLIPYTKIKNIIYDKDNMFAVKYRTSFENDFQICSLHAVEKKKMGIQKNKKMYFQPLL